MPAFKKNKRQKSLTPKSKIGEVRLIGGEFRGRKLPVLLQEGLRPTSDRVKETLFNWLQFSVPNAVCLDAFSGAGSLGFEALSRGAKSVTFCELSSPVAKQLQQNLTTLKISNAQVYQIDTLTFLKTPPSTPCDIIFIDPPFHQGLMQPTVDLIFEKNWLKNDQAWLYLEQEKALPWPKLPKNWICHREKTTSQVKYALFTQEIS